MVRCTFAARLGSIGIVDPSNTFDLLSGAFDKCAKRRGVFKVETIGDSYVAVTGCPTPCKDRKWC